VDIELHNDHVLYATVVHHTISLTAPHVMHGSHLRRFVIFDASHLVILSHSVCDFVSVILVDFLL